MIKRTRTFDHNINGNSGLAGVFANTRLSQNSYIFQVAVNSVLGYTLMMSTAFQIFLGIDISSGPKPVTFMALDAERKPLAIGEGDVADALAYAAGPQAGVLAAAMASLASWRVPF